MGVTQVDREQWQRVAAAATGAYSMRSALPVK